MRFAKQRNVHVPEWQRMRDKSVAASRLREIRIGDRSERWNKSGR
jgi:hypothetical protein